MSKISKNQMGTTGQINPPKRCNWTQLHFFRAQCPRLQMISWKPLVQTTQSWKRKPPIKSTQAQGMQLKWNPLDQVSPGAMCKGEVTNSPLSFSHQFKKITKLSFVWKLKMECQLWPTILLPTNPSKQNHKSWKTQNAQWKETLPGTGQCVNWRRARISGALCTANVCRQVTH